MDADERKDVIDEFGAVVNLTASELDEWLDTDDSRSVGEGSGESKGHASGRRIVKLLRTRQDDLTDDDVEHMRTVVGYVHRHEAQRPQGDVQETNWRYSLMNWGHDPVKD